jgi:hypothetical protein
MSTKIRKAGGVSILQSFMMDDGMVLEKGCGGAFKSEYLFFTHIMHGLGYELKNAFLPFISRQCNYSGDTM